MFSCLLLADLQASKFIYLYIMFLSVRQKESKTSEQNRTEQTKERLVHAEMEVTKYIYLVAGVFG